MTLRFRRSTGRRRAAGYLFKPGLVFRTGQQREVGSAVVEFVMVGALTTLIFISVVQLALTLHVRNTLIDAAASGARFGTLADRTPQEGAERTKQLISSALNPGFAEHVSFSTGNDDGVRTLIMTVRAPLPVLGLLGVPGSLEVVGHAALQP